MPAVSYCLLAFLRVSWGIQLVGVEESSEKKSVLSGSRQRVDSPETVSGSAGGPGPWRVETQLRGDNQWKHTTTKKISVVFFSFVRRPYIYVCKDVRIRGILRSQKGAASKNVWETLL
jgi:hypothetical protein